MSDFQMPVHNDEEPSRESTHEFDDLPSLQQLVNSLDPKRREFIEKLPTLSEDDLRGLNQADSFCPICYNTFGAITAEAELASAMDTPAVAAQHLGVTRLAETCGHVFCRKDITTWIERNNKCPTCRTPFYEAPVPSFPTLQSFTLSNLMPDLNDLMWNASPSVQTTTTQAAAPEVVSSESATGPGTAGQPANTRSSDTSVRDNADAANSGTDPDAQRSANDDAVARMLQRMRNLGQGSALSDIMYGLSVTGRNGRRQQEPDDDRNEYAGLYS